MPISDLKIDVTGSLIPFAQGTASGDFWPSAWGPRVRSVHNNQTYLPYPLVEFMRVSPVYLDTTPRVPDSLAVEVQPGLTAEKANLYFYSSSSFTSPRSALAFSMIFSCNCAGTMS